MNAKIMEIAERVKALREIMDYSTLDMARAIGIPESEYVDYEAGKKDFNFTFLYNCAEKFGVDIMEIITGENPRLNFYTVTRAGEGMPIKRREGFTYQHLAHLFKNRDTEPMIVTAPYHEEEQDKPIETRSHDGQEFDYVISGQLKVNLDGFIEVLNPGDSIYYNSACKHGMIATGGTDCTFIAVVIKK